MNVMLAAARTPTSHAIPSRHARSTRDAVDLRDVEFVEAVARYANFTRAATDLRIAQPALSATIRRLEAKLRVRLFDRTTRRVALTDAGEAFVARARRILLEFEQLAEEMGEFASGTRGVVRVSWWSHADPELITFLRRYQVTNPGVQIDVSEQSAEDAAERVRSGEIAIASIAFDHGVDLSGTTHRVARRDSLVLVTAPDHPLAHMESVHIGEIGAEAFVATGPGSGSRACLGHAFAGRGQPHVAVETADLASLVDFVAAGVGVAILPRSIAQPASPRVTLVALEDARPLVLALVWREGRHAPATQMAIDLLVGT
jgi:LysR family transcriptional activator of glutamate synthase operon